MAEEKLLNTSTLSVSVEAGSFGAWAGPIVQNQLAAAIAAYKVIAHQYIQLLDVVSMIAGPAMTPVGAAAAHASRETGLITWNFTADPAVAAEVAGWTAGADPIDSAWRDISSRAANAPSVFLDRKIYGPYTGTPGAGSPSIVMQHGVASGAVIPWPSGIHQHHLINARVNAVKKVKIQVFTGTTGQASGVCTVEEFVNDVARPLLEAYQAVVEKMYARLKATTASDGAVQSTLWAALNTVTPDATRRMYEKLEVLRDPAGFPLFSPARQEHALRDKLVGGVISVMFDFPVVTALSQ